MKAGSTLYRTCVLVLGAALLGTAPAQAGRLSQLPDVASLDKNSDFVVFMQDGVPQDLKSQALRKLWRSDPVIAQGDDLTDYGDDYRADPAPVSSAYPTHAQEVDGADARPVAAVPAIATLGDDSDYRAFMQPDVPEHIRARALRKLWRTDPVIAQGDNLTDYGDDYRKAGKDLELAAKQAIEAEQARTGGV